MRGRKCFEEISKKSEKFGMLQRFMKYSRTDVVGIDHENVINGTMKMVGKYFQKITKHENESNEKKLRYSFNREKMKRMMVEPETDARQTTQDR